MKSRIFEIVTKATEYKKYLKNEKKIFSSGIIWISYKCNQIHKSDTSEIKLSKISQPSALLLQKNVSPVISWDTGVTVCVQ